MTFREAYTFPLQRRFGGTKVLTADYNVAFDFFFPLLEPNCLELSFEVKDEIIAKLNGEDKAITIPNLVLDETSGTLYSNGRGILRVRGWGYLTGTGGLGLPEAEACSIQNEFAHYILETLKEKE